MVDTLNTHQEPKPESQEYIDNMVAKAEGLDNTQEERPEWLPSKFNSPGRHGKCLRRIRA